MGEKILIHAAYPLSRKHLLVTVARARQLQDNGDDVVMTYCAAKGGVCTVNHTGNPALCNICQATLRGTAKSAGIKTIPLSDEAASSLASSQQPTNSERRRLVEGVYSDLISRFRLLKSDLNRNPLLRAIKSRYYQTALRRMRAFLGLIESQQPDRVEVFNGRLACGKFPLLAAKRHDLPITTLEIGAGGIPIVFDGHTAHDRHAIQQRMLSCEADMEQAEEYFSRRRSPKFSRFTKQQQGGFTPPDMSAFDRKFTFFLSSQDEFESLGPDWRSSFDDYAAVVEAACRRFPNDFFVVRFHPNQGKIRSDILTPFAPLEALPNAQIYEPDSGVNSYELIEWSDVVITFGSTVTLEACWAGRPTIMLGPSFFDQLGIALSPATMQQFLELLAGEVPVSDRTNAARAAAFWLADNDPLPNLQGSGNRMTPIGFRRSHRGLARMSRLFEKFASLLIKPLARMTAKRQTPLATDESPVEKRAQQQRAQQQRAA